MRKSDAKIKKNKAREKASNDRETRRERRNPLFGPAAAPIVISSSESESESIVISSSESESESKSESESESLDVICIYYDTLCMST